MFSHLNNFAIRRKWISCPSPDSIRAAKLYQCFNGLPVVVVAAPRTRRRKLFECCMLEDNLQLIRVFACHNGFIRSLSNAQFCIMCLRCWYYSGAVCLVGSNAKVAVTVTQIFIRLLAGKWHYKGNHHKTQIIRGIWRLFRWKYQSKTEKYFNWQIKVTLVVNYHDRVMLTYFTYYGNLLFKNIRTHKGRHGESVGRTVASHQEGCPI